MKTPCACFIFCLSLVAHVGVGEARKQREETRKQQETIDCALYERDGSKYFLVRSFAPYKVGISCRNQIFMYVCPRNKDAWFSLLDPTLDLRESCSEEYSPRHVWEKQWVINTQIQPVAVSKDDDKETEEEVVVGPVPSTIQLKFECELL
jgi:hypothetical protein